jgi:hypothetical protein
MIEEIDPKEHLEMEKQKEAARATEAKDPPRVSAICRRRMGESGKGFDEVLSEFKAERPEYFKTSEPQNKEPNYSDPGSLKPGDIDVTKLTVEQYRAIRRERPELLGL